MREAVERLMHALGWMPTERERALEDALEKVRSSHAEDRAALEAVERELIRTTRSWEMAEMRVRELARRSPSIMGEMQEGTWRMTTDNRSNEPTPEQVERDAAVAAIERVRKYADERSVYAKTRNNTVGSWRIASDLYDILNVPIEEQKALDGAPEPEEEELPETGLEMRDSDGDLIVSGEHRKVLHQGMYVCDSCVNDLGLNVRWDRAGFMEGHRLPVEGEKP